MYCWSLIFVVGSFVVTLSKIKFCVGLKDLQLLSGAWLGQELRDNRKIPSPKDKMTDSYVSLRTYRAD